MARRSTRLKDAAIALDDARHHLTQVVDTDDEVEVIVTLTRVVLAKLLGSMELARQALSLVEDDGYDVDDAITILEQREDWVR
jgi:hypothetical protein